MELYIGSQREKSLHVIINYSTRARTELKGGVFLVTREFEVPKRHILRPRLSTNMVNMFCGGSGKRGNPVRKGKSPWQRNVVIV